MSLPPATAERRERDAADASLIDAAREVVTAEKRCRWQAPWRDEIARHVCRVQLEAAIASLREVVLRQTIKGPV